MNSNKPLKIAIVGGGNVGTHLFKALHLQGVLVNQFLTSNKSGLINEILQSGCGIIQEPKQIDADTNLVILAIADDALNSHFLNKFSKKLFLAHTSGSVEMSVLKDFDNYGVFYPLQTFSKSRNISYKNIPFCIESNSDQNTEFLVDLAQKISDDVRIITSDQRQQIHLAAVFACNFSNYLFHISETILKEKNLDFDILFPLLSETIQKVHFASPREMQTGPAIRKDVKIMQKHLALLSEHPEFGILYELISNNISKLNKDS